MGWLEELDDSPNEIVVVRLCDMDVDECSRSWHELARRVVYQYAAVYLRRLCLGSSLPEQIGFHRFSLKESPFDRTNACSISSPRDSCLLLHEAITPSFCYVRLNLVW